MSDFKRVDAENMAEALQQALDHNAEHGGSRIIDYQGLQIVVPLHDLRQGVDLLHSRGETERAMIMASINHSLHQNLADVKAGTAPQKVAMEFGQDVCLWFANEVVAGRTTLEIN